jgi:hypothetical protein
VIALGAFLAVPAVRAALDTQAAQTRPIALGTSGGNINDFLRGGSFCASGTLGSLVTDGVNQYILSNNHVLARENAASIGDDIDQPGLIDVGCQQIASDVVADLSNFVTLSFKKGTTNSVDAAIAQTRAGTVQTDGSILGIGTVSNLTATAVVGCEVQKVGRTTGLTTGAVYATDTTVSVKYNSGTAKFTNQILVTPGTFSAGGDSGSLVVRSGSNPRPVGLLFAGSSSYTIANPIDAVTSALGVSMVGSGDGSDGDCASAPTPTSTPSATPTATATPKPHGKPHDAKAHVEDALLSLPDVVGVGVGANGTVEVFLANDNAQTRRQIPSQVEGVPVHVQVSGAFEAR